MRILLFDDAHGLVGNLRDALAAAGYRVVGQAGAPHELSELIERLQPDVVLLAQESPSRDTMEQVVVVSERSPRPIVMVTNDASPASMRKAMQAGISAYVVSGLPADQLDTLFDLAVARFEEDQRLRNALRDAEDQLADRKRIDRAKGLLMQSRGCTEDEAYRLMRRMAMDRCLKLRDLAAQLSAMQSPPTA